MSREGERSEEKRNEVKPLVQYCTRFDGVGVNVISWADWSVMLRRAIANVDVNVSEFEYDCKFVSEFESKPFLPLLRLFRLFRMDGTVISILTICVVCCVWHISMSFRTSKAENSHKLTALGCEVTRLQEEKESLVVLCSPVDETSFSLI